MNREHEGASGGRADTHQPAARFTHAKLYVVVGVAAALIASLCLLADLGFGTLDGIRGFVIREAIEAEPFQLPDEATLQITCSVGYSTYPMPVEGSCSWEDAISVADAALLLAKEQGRNRCIGVELLKAATSPADMHTLLADLGTAIESGRVRALP